MSAARAATGTLDGREQLTTMAHPPRPTPAHAALALLALLALLPALLVPAARAEAAPRHGTLMVFGDSYSVGARNGVRGWPLLLRDADDVTMQGNHAEGGATAASLPTGRSTFERQVDAWLARVPRRVADVTVAFFGYNDVRGDRPLAAAKAAYTAQVDRLIRAGAGRNGKRLLLVQIHDIARNPATRGYGRARTQGWNRHVAAVARARPGVEIVDLFALFERVFRQPGLHGLRNVTTVDRARSSTTALFFDDFHFGLRGQRLIAGAVRSTLDRPARSYRVVGEGEAAALPSSPLPPFSAALDQPPRSACCQ